MSFVIIGKVVNTQGIKGELRVYHVTDDVSRFDCLDTVTLRKDGDERKFTLLSSRPHKNVVLIRLDGIEDMTAAEKLVGYEILADEAELPPLEEGEYYARDLYGLKVVTEDGLELGTLTDIIFTGANDVYSVKTEQGKEVLIPAIKQCILNIDIRGGTMTVSLLEGLM